MSCLSSLRVVNAALTHPVANQVRDLGEACGMDLVSLVRILCEFGVDRGHAGKPLRDAAGCIIGSTNEPGVWFGRVGRPGTKDLGEVYWSAGAAAGERLRLVA